MTNTNPSSKKSPSLYEALCADLRAIGVVRPRLWRMFLCFFSSSEFTPVLLYRLAAACRGRGKVGKIAERFFLRLNNLLNSCYISSEATIGPSLHLPHPTGIVIGGATLGYNVRIFQNVTIGLRLSLPAEFDDRYPVIGDNVEISAGAVILGNIKIGNNVVIGANAVVLKDVPDNSLAVGVPARVLPRG